MSINLSFIGVGNMAKAMIDGILTSGFTKPENIYGFDISESSQAYAAEAGINFSKDCEDCASKSDYVILAVKPAQQKAVLEQLSENQDHKVFVSISAGITIDAMEASLGKESKIIRTMPNLPISVGAGYSVLCPNANVTPEELTLIKSLFACFGYASELSEDKIDAFSVIASCTPALFAVVIEALSDGGVQMGLSRADSYKMAITAMLGTAKMLDTSGMHPAVLKDMVTSPAGTTIEMIRTLELHGFRSALIESELSALDKCKKLGS